MPTRRALLALLVAAGCSRAAPDAPVRVAAAADLALAFEALGRRFTAQTGRRVVFSFGSTGMLARQIREGAPFDVFAAAHVSYIDAVVATGACDGATRAPYARGRLALWTRRGGVTPPTTLADLAHPRFRRVALANPAHAPYGQAAREALTQLGVWGAVERRLVLGENVRQTLQYAQTGNVDAALVALSLVVNDRENPWIVVEESLHRPIAQALAVCGRGANRAGGLAFARFVNAAEGRAVMRQHGFLLPGEPAVQAP
ncbi:MAG: molybdate ABC transporter substrate-binding protein [Polyangiales bacterium]